MSDHVVLLDETERLLKEWKGSLYVPKTCEEKGMMEMVHRTLTRILETTNSEEPTPSFATLLEDMRWAKFHAYEPWRRIIVNLVLLIQWQHTVDTRGSHRERIVKCVRELSRTEEEGEGWKVLGWATLIGMTVLLYSLRS